MPAPREHQEAAQRCPAATSEPRQTNALAPSDLTHNRRPSIAPIPPGPEPSASKHVPDFTATPYGRCGPLDPASRQLQIERRGR